MQMQNGAAGFSSPESRPEVRSTSHFAKSIARTAAARRRWLAVIAMPFLLVACDQPIASSTAAPAPPGRSGIDGFVPPGATCMGNLYRKTVLEGYGPGSTKYEFTLNTGPLSELPPDKTAATHLWGWGNPESERDLLPRAAHVVEFKLSVEGQPVSIPREAIVDLINLRPDFEVGPVIEVRPAVFVCCRGGDAGESYFVRFTVQDGRLAQRDVWHGEFPEAGPTTTKYAR